MEQVLEIIVTVVRFVAILTALIMIHEAGHYFTARAFGVHVLEFGLGFPPRLFSYTHRETRYSINWLPLGGFVRLLGEELPTHPWSLASKGALTRFTVLAAGSVMNLVLAVFLFVFLSAVPQQHFEGRVVITAVAESSPAQLAGLQGGDVVLQVDGHDVKSAERLKYRIMLKLGQETDWLVMRPERLMTGGLGFGVDAGPVAADVRDTAPFPVTLTPRWDPPEGEGNVGVQIRTDDGQMVRSSGSLLLAVPNGFLRMWEFVTLLRNEVARWFLGSGGPQLAGPVGIAQISGEVAESGWRPLVAFSALLSLNLAIVNLLPLPALDGGRIVFVALEWVRRGKRVPPEREGVIHAVGFALLISAIAVITYFDIARIVQGG